MQRRLGRLVAIGCLLSALTAVQGPAVWAEDYSNTAASSVMGESVRSQGMGGAYVALTGDPWAVLQNPAGLASLENPAFGGVYRQEYGLLSDFQGALGFRHLGVGLQYLTADSEPTDEAGEPTGASLRPSELTASLGLAAGAGPVALGVTGSYFSQSLDTTSGSAITGSAGALLSAGPVRVGVVAKNLFGSIAYDDLTEDDLDRVFAAGISVAAGPVTVAGDCEFPNGTAPDGVTRGGAELVLGPVALRVGARTASPGLTYTAGLGLHLDQVRLDYAYMLHSSLPGSHRLGLTLDLGPSPRPATVQSVSSQPTQKAPVPVAPRPPTPRPQGVTVKGRIVDPDGNPIRAVVSAWQVTELNARWTSRNAWQIPGWTPPRTVTDEDGFFELQGLRDYPELKTHQYWLHVEPQDAGYRAPTGYYISVNYYGDGATINLGLMVAPRVLP